MTCDVCHFPLGSQKVVRTSAVSNWTIYLCFQCEALQAEPLYMVEERADAGAGDWIYSIMTYVQSPRSKGGIYCDFDDLAT